MANLFADIIVPLPLSQTYTYSIPENMKEQIAVGKRVIVNFGKSRFYTGIVTRLHNDIPSYDRIKPITEIIDEKPILIPQQLQLWYFMSAYYQTSLGDIYRVALPSGFKIENESIVDLIPEKLEEYTPSRAENNVIELLNDGQSHKINEFNTSQIKHIKHLIDVGIIAKTDKLNDNYKPKYTDFIAINPIYANSEKLTELMLGIKRAKKQVELLQCYIDISKNQAIEKQTLLEKANASTAILKQLTDKDILRIEKRRCYRIDITSEVETEIHELTEAQKVAYQQIKEGFTTHESVLLHGVTASGKTEIYIQLIKDTIARGEQVLMLVPEAGLTQQLANRMKQFFGGEMGIFHSFCSSYERVETYQHQLSDTPYNLIIGVKTSVFLPFKKLGLIIIDEEHDLGYKQIEPAPRYHARDVATYLARLHKAKTLLGTATPAVETYANCYSGKYKLVELNERYGKVALPKIELINIKECYRKKQMKGHFSLEMIENIKSTIEKGQQVLLFQNRRGFSPYIKCPQCGYIPKCPNCDVSLTYHKHNNTLSCHYCGHTISFDTKLETRDTKLNFQLLQCPQCKDTQLTTQGFGTEQVEDEVRVLFPELRVARLDLDTSRSVKAFDSIIGAFQNGEIDILIGTQMVTKGIDFENIGLVGILNADNLLYHPDFRATERAYQMLVQVSGRTSRRTEQGKVLIQTYQPEHPIFQQIVKNDYKAFFSQDMLDRHAFHYPPYVKLMRIIVKHEDNTICNRTAELLANKLKIQLRSRILGPDTPSIAKIQNKYIRQILVKIEINASIQQVKEIIRNEIQGVQLQKPYNTANIQFDVDPI